MGAKQAWLNNSKKPASYDTSHNSSSLVRLVEDPGIPKSIEFDEISIDFAVDNEGNAAEQIYTSNDSAAPTYEEAGVDYPVIRINDTLIPKLAIKRFEIESSDFIPTINLTLSYNNTTFLVRNMPKDGDMISTFVCLNTSNLNYLRNDFIITSCSSSSNNSNGTSKIFLTGKMFIPEFDSTLPEKAFGFIGTSKETLKEVAKKFKIGFSYNDEDDTDDFQNWICCRQTVPDFVQDVVDHCWKNGETFFNTWIDFYYDLCFVNVNKFLWSSENTEDEIDETFKTTTVKFVEMMHDAEKDKSVEILKIFSNNGSFKGTPFYIKSWHPVNNASSISLNTGYESDSYTYVSNQDTYNEMMEEDSSTCFDIAENFPAYDKSKLNDHIIFRGRGKWTSANPKDDKKRVNYDFVNTYINVDWTGVHYVMSDKDKDIKDNTQWAGNVHKNYSHSYYHNRLNRAELDKMYIEVDVEGLCLQVMRGERIPIYIVYENVVENLENNAPHNEDISSLTNKFYSGFYIVDSISYSYKEHDTAYSNYTTHMILKRREWPTPEPTQEDLYDNSKEIKTSKRQQDE